jgi:hypothetical protein
VLAKRGLAVSLPVAVLIGFGLAVQLPVVPFALDLLALRRSRLRRSGR